MNGCSFGNQTSLRIVDVANYVVTIVCGHWF